MRKLYALFVLIAATVMGANAQPMKAAGDVTTYNGNLKVEMMGTVLTENQAVTVTLTEDEGGTYTFLLPDFVISVGGTPLECGDIRVEGVTRTDNDGDGVIDVAGSVNDLSLAEGMIHAKVEIAGTETLSGEMSLAITVGWYLSYDEGDMESVIPINVSFVGQREDGGSVEAVATGASVYGSDGAVEVSGYEGEVCVYGADGRLVSKAWANGSARLSVSGGLYVVRIGSRAVKVLVK